jgi:uncharacterized damage-inducible protein DinB
LRFTTSGPTHVSMPQRWINHQTHHRGQARACLSILARDEPPSLDLLAFSEAAPHQI